ncbi:hypothetical protein ABEY96_28880 [Priestia aryabhattai]|uniref:AbiJ-related protein n=1 Tax=Priestia aryabhattai TaxID=412384 RepID=UPI003D2C6508
MADINELINEITMVLSEEKAYDVPNVCVKYGLDNGSEGEAFQSKRVYVQKRLKGKDQLFLLDLAKRIVRDYSTSAKSLSKLLSQVSPTGIFHISEITRRNIMNELYSEINIPGKMDIVSFLKRTWELDNMPSTDSRFINAAGDIWQHTVNNDDFDDPYLFEEYLEVLTADDDLFINFLEQLVHPLVRETTEQEECVNLLNSHLKKDGFRLLQMDYMSGYPIYKVNKIKDGVKGAVKNLIFAAIGAKPQIVISDSLNNSIKVVKNEDNCLIYEQPIPSTGLFWDDLVNWWKTLNPNLKSYRDIQVSLYNRLYNSLDSHPEKIFFKSYFKLLKESYNKNLPALIPQVYLHYDPYTKSQRNGQAYLARQRMDFLLILPNEQRVVIEIDGKQHYSVGSTSNPKKYAEMVSADRDIKLQGYEVYRFGGYELLEEHTSLNLLGPFFKRLLSKHEINPIT